jgi:hypothetical protein
VPLFDWLQCDGLEVILLHRTAKLKATILTLLAKLDTALPAVFGDHQWQSAFSLFVERSKFPKNEVNELAKQLALLGSLEEAVQVGLDDLAACKRTLTSNDAVAGVYRQRVADLTDELLQHRVADAHFLPCIDPAERVGECNGYVVILRHVTTLAGSWAQRIEAGFVASEVDASPLFDFSGGAVGVLSNLASPHVEHVMQRFAQLFTRIGITDCSDVYRNRLIEEITVTKRQ